MDVRVDLDFSFSSLYGIVTAYKLWEARILVNLIDRGIAQYNKINI
jgi:hypothetical protein